MSNLARVCLAGAIVLLISINATFARDRAMESKLEEAFEAGKLPGLHSVLILRKGEVFAETHFSGKDERWGQPLGNRRHDTQSLHDLRSVTKPIVGLLYGIALSEGKVPDLETAILDQFPKYADLAKNEKRQAILIRHVLSMKMGTEWNEDLPYSNPKNSEIAMELAEDRYRFVLDRPMINEPGDYWVYNGGAVALIAKIISDGVGKPIDQYAEEKLFSPLGIKQFEWIKGADGVPSAASGLRLSIHDLAKIGELIRQNGRIGREQIVPEAWLKESFTPRSSLQSGLRYGYFWWLAQKSWGDPPAWMSGFGNGGQRLTVQPKYGLTIAIFAGNYNQQDAWQLPVKIIEKFLTQALKGK